MTESKRRKDREAAKAKAKEHLRGGRTEEAKREFTKAVDITHEHAVELMRECRKQGVDCITAMYEADSQLAYLNKIGVAEYVISEDSDLILFGCKKIIFKLQLDGRCLLFESEKLHLALGVSKEKFSFDKFRRICILSGCDYLDSLHGIGLAKAKKFILLTEETDMKRALVKLPSYLNIKNLAVTDGYIDGFLKADATFKYMFVYDPLKRSMVRLNDLAEDDPEEEHCTNAGQVLPPDKAFQLALGNLNPRTFEQLDNFNPDNLQPSAKKIYHSTRHASIWKRSENTPIVKSSFSKQIGIVNFFKSAPRKHQNLTEVQNIIEQENNVTSEVVVDDLLLKYYVAEIAPAKRRTESDDDNDVVENTPTPSRNPFAKRHQPEPEAPKVGSSPSLLKSIASSENRKSIETAEKRRVKSRFFLNKNSSLSSGYDSQSQQETTPEMEEEMKKFLAASALHDEMTAKRLAFYDAMKSATRVEQSNDEGVSAAQSEEIKTEEGAVVDLDRYEFQQKSQNQTYVDDWKPKPLKTKPRQVLSKPKPKASTQNSNDSMQTKLSKFGFLKKPSCSQVD